MPAMSSAPLPGRASFRPARWLAGPHLQTLGAALLPTPPVPARERAVFELPDGDFVEVHWSSPRRPGAPLMVVLHGLEGSAESRYARRILAAADATGWQGVVLHARGCGGTPNRLPRGYHAGETGDLAAFLEAAPSMGHETVTAVGYSLGGNVLAKYLGERGPAARLVAAVAVSVPYDLRDAAAAVDVGFARLYRNRLLKLMKRRLREGLDSGRLDPRWAAALEARDFRSFDALFTAPVHGFTDVDDYYDRCSARGYLSRIRKPTLLLHALDDPLMTPACLPDAAQLPPAVRLEAYPEGGHVGFVSGGTPWRPATWLEPRILGFLSSAVPAGIPAPGA